MPSFIRLAKGSLSNTSGDDFDAFLSTLGYPCVEETDNPAYRLFLQSGADAG